MIKVCFIFHGIYLCRGVEYMNLKKLSFIEKQLLKKITFYDKLDSTQKNELFR